MIRDILSRLTTQEKEHPMTDPLRDGLQAVRPIPTAKRPLSETAAQVADEITKLLNQLAEREGIIQGLEKDGTELRARIAQQNDELERVREKADYYQRTTITLRTRLSDAGGLIAKCLEEVGAVPAASALMVGGELASQLDQELARDNLRPGNRPSRAAITNRDIEALARAITGDNSPSRLPNILTDADSRETQK